MVTRPLRNDPQFTAYLALICVCFFWGTTYLGFRIALDSFGPITLVAIRNLISAGLILAWALAVKSRMPRGRELWMTAALGVMIIGLGNAGVAIAEQWVPTGITSLFVTTSAFWYVALDAMLPGGERLHSPTVAGLGVGFLGVLLLMAPSALDLPSSETAVTGGALLLGFLVLQTTGVSWSLGSILYRNRQRNVKEKIHPFVVAGIQQLATGVVFGLASFFEPRRPVFDWHGMSGILFLSIFGGIIGYGSYMTALNRLPLAVVSTYTYINPVVAVTLGWLIYSEEVGPLQIAAMLVIFAGVWIVRRASNQKSAPPLVRAAPLETELDSTHD